MKAIYLLLFVVSACSAVAQNEIDILRYSTNQINGNARNIALGGTMASFGWDFSAVQMNPAAIGRTRKTTYSITGGLDAANSNANFYSSKHIKNSFGGGYIGSASYVKAYRLNQKKFENWRYVQIGMGYENLINFQREFEYRGNVNASILNAFAKKANGTNVDDIYEIHPFDAGLAYDVFALDPGAVPNTYDPAYKEGSVMHERNVSQWGGLGEYNFMMSGNWKEKIYVGGTVKISRAKFNEDFTHTETFVDSLNGINSLNYYGNIETRGIGTAMRIGGIYLPVDNIRLGLSYQTPTTFRLKDEWSNNMDSQTDDGPKFIGEEFVPEGEFAYRLRTPSRLNATLGYIFKNRGGIGIAIERRNYKEGKLSDVLMNREQESFGETNDVVQNILRPVYNINVGAELRLTPFTYARLGFAHYPSPYKLETGNTEEGTQFYTMGFGWNTGKIFLDLACSFRQARETSYVYDAATEGSKVDYRNFDSSISLTLGWRID